MFLNFISEVLDEQDQVSALNILPHPKEPTGDKWEPEDISGDIDRKQFEEVLCSIDLIIYISDAPAIYPWEGQKVKKWRTRSIEAFDQRTAKLSVYHDDADSERKRIMGIFDKLESEVTEEDL